MGSAKGRRAINRSQQLLEVDPNSPTSRCNAPYLSVASRLAQVHCKGSGSKIALAGGVERSPRDGKGEVRRTASTKWSLRCNTYAPQ